MKKVLSLAALFLIFATGIWAQSQTSNSLPFTAQSPPAAPTLTSLGNLSSTGKIYTGQVIAVTGTGFTGTCVVNVDGAAQPGTSYILASPTLINFTVPASLGSSAGTPHTLTVSCPMAVLTMNTPVTLPNAKVGTSYSANLGQLAQVQGGTPPLTYSLSSGALPTGLSLSPSGIVAGLPSGAGSFNFGFTVKDATVLVNHSGVLTWTASLGGSIPPAAVAGYNLYRGDVTGGPTRSSTLRQFRR